MTRSRKHSLVTGILAVLACLLAGNRANAQADDLFNAAGKDDLPRVKALLAERGQTARADLSRAPHRIWLQTELRDLRKGELK